MLRRRNRRSRLWRICHDTASFRLGNPRNGEGLIVATSLQMKKAVKGKVAG